MSISNKSRLPLTLVLVAAFTVMARPSSAQSVQRGEWEDVLKQVSADVQKNFYDPRMKGLDWSALTEETRQRIKASGNVGQMILAISSLLDRLQDSHTYFIPPPLTAYSDFGFRAKAYGNDVRVNAIEKKGPAEKAGLQVGNTILSVNGITVDRTNIQEVLRIVTALAPATAVDLIVVPSGVQARTLHIAAHLITAPPHQYINSVWRVADLQRARDARVNFLHKEYENNVSYIAIPSFRTFPEVTYSEIEKAKHARVLVLDLRGNRGGLVETVVECLGFFTDRPTMVAKKVLRSGSQDLMVTPRKSGFAGSTIVLVDADTASGAELVARYLQLSGKATVLGDWTSGMVNEGQLIPGKIGAGFVMPFATVVTTAQLVMSNGEELEKRGVIPDTKCVPTAQDLIQGADPCLEKALALARKSVLENEKH